MLNSIPLVSVITPSYNHAKYIQQTIESVVKQTYKNIEYFIVDDGSTDNSEEIIISLKAKYNFNFEVQRNKGLAFTMNKLIAKCKGKYIALIESDDVWTLDKIEKQVEFLENNAAFAVCGGNALCINEESEILPGKNQTIKKYTVYNQEDIMLFNFHIFPLTVMTRREIYEEVGAFDDSMVFIDAFTWLKVAANNHSIVILPDLFGFYRIHKSNVHYESFKMYETLIKTIDKFKDHSLYLKARRNALSLSFPYLAVNNKIRAISILPKAFKFKWRIIKGLIVLFIPFSILKLFKRIPYK